MPVERVEWVCPGCQRRYAIPASAPTPALCPSCQQARRAEGAADSAAEIEPAPVVIPPLVETPMPRGVAHRSSLAAPHAVKYPALRSIAFGYKVLSALLALASLAALLFAIYGAVTIKDAGDRTMAIYVGLGVFVGGGLAAVFHLAAAELIHVAIDIEENTRRH